MTKLMEKLEKVTEERKQKERTLLHLYSEEGNTMEDDSDGEDDA
ncbi:Protein CBG23040 [Caenorhabditis briggsae]|nr:Protein CBG23040 [Caenorhabditis briggsae]CAP39406.1 Protein CBG23040 [Caenorhabditis briggsae]